MSREGQGQLLCLEKMFLGAALEPAETVLLCGISGLHREEQCLQTSTVCVCVSLWVPGHCWHAGHSWDARHCETAECGLDAGLVLAPRGTTPALTGQGGSCPQLVAPCAP